MAKNKDSSENSIIHETENVFDSFFYILDDKEEEDPFITKEKEEVNAAPLDDLFGPEPDSYIDGEAQDSALENKTEDLQKAIPAEKTERITGPEEISMPVTSCGYDETELLAFQLGEAILTLDWEASKENIYLVKDLIGKLREKPINKHSEYLKNMLRHLDSALGYLPESSEGIPPSLPRILKKCYKTLKKVIFDESLSSESIRNLSSAFMLDIRSLLPDCPEHSRNQKTFLQSVQGHIGELDKCLTKLSDAERLLANNPAYDSMTVFHKNLAEILSRQKSMLIDAVSESLQQEVPLRKRTGTPCPWENLATTTLHGKPVAYVMEQVVFENKISMNIATVLAKKKVLNLKSLMPRQGTTLSYMFKGSLENESESKLKNMEFPVMEMNDSAYLADSGTKNSMYLLILYFKGKGIAVMNDVPLKKLDISDNFIWEPSPESGSSLPLVAGSLNSVDGERINVISLSMLKS